MPSHSSQEVRQRRLAGPTLLAPRPSSTVQVEKRSAPKSRPLFTRPRPRRSSFFFNDTATTEIYTLSLHDALPIYSSHTLISYAVFCLRDESVTGVDRKSTRLNSRHTLISYAVFRFTQDKHSA